MEIVGPGVTDVACYQRIALTRDFVGEPYRLAIHPLQVVLAAHVLQLFTMGIVSESHHHLTACPQEFAMQLLNGFGRVQHDLWHIGPGLDIPSALQLKDIAFRTQHNAIVQSLKNTSRCSVAHSSSPSAKYLVSTIPA